MVWEEDWATVNSAGRTEEALVEEEEEFMVERAWVLGIVTV